MLNGTWSRPSALLKTENHSYRSLEQNRYLSASIEIVYRLDSTKCRGAVLVSAGPATGC